MFLHSCCTTNALNEWSWNVYVPSGIPMSLHVWRSTTGALSHCTSGIPLVWLLVRMCSRDRVWSTIAAQPSVSWNVIAVAITKPSLDRCNTLYTRRTRWFRSKPNIMVNIMFPDTVLPKWFLFFRRLTLIFFGNFNSVLTLSAQI